MLQKTLFLSLFLFLSLSVNAIEIKLGTKEHVTELFSYPNAEHVDQSIEETVFIWMNSTLSREGYRDYSIRINQNDGEYVVDISMDDENAQSFKEFFEKFLNVGDIGLRLTKEFQKTGKWNETWRFLLPIGMAMGNSLTIEMMDFPPVSLLSRQDYLISQTTKRWKDLLALNQVAFEDLDKYSAILDIVPVAAPASGGRVLDDSGIYDGPFNEYTFALLSLWCRKVSTHEVKPMIAFGAPIRKWIQKNFGINLPVLDITTIFLPDNTEIPVISSNHPSYFYYAVHASKDLYENIKKGLEILKQDIVVACWQVEMGNRPSSDPFDVREECTEKWKGRERDLIPAIIKHGSMKVKPEELDYDKILSGQEQKEENGFLQY